jgi:hypothetical protein
MMHETIKKIAKAQLNCGSFRLMQESFQFHVLGSLGAWTRWQLGLNNN